MAGAAALPRLRARMSPDALLAAGSAGMAVVTLLLAYAHLTAAVAVALVVAGACWILVLSTLNSLYQLSLPQWVKARGMSFYLMVFQGGGAVGSAGLALFVYLELLDAAFSFDGVTGACDATAGSRLRYAKRLAPARAQSISAANTAIAATRLPFRVFALSPVWPHDAWVLASAAK